MPLLVCIFLPINLNIEYCSNCRITLKEVIEENMRVRRVHEYTGRVRELRREKIRVAEER